FLCVPYAVFLALLGAVELGVRATRPYLSSLDAFVAAPEQQAQFVDRHRVRVFEGDPLLFWRLQPNLRGVVWDKTRVTTNERGLRYPAPVGRKAPGTFRILCAGDSVTFGFRVPLVFDNRPEERQAERLPYPARLEKALRAANPGRAIEVIPLAVPGYSSHQGLAWMRRDLEELQPDVVTLLYGWNDIGFRPQPDRVAMKTDRWSVASRAMLARSQALLHLWRFWHAPRGDPAAATRAQSLRVAREEFVANHRAMVALARTHGARAVVLGPIYRDREEYPAEAVFISSHRAALRAAMAADGVPYLEFPELTEDAYPDNQALFLEHIHPNHKGHRLLAEALLAYLARQGLLGDLHVPAAEASRE
ncbi:MAG TPA: GDSL-type esterase/lipase family protein, partial [Vicinamibacteria bacterium]